MRGDDPKRIAGTVVGKALQQSSVPDLIIVLGLLFGYCGVILPDVCLVGSHWHHRAGPQSDLNAS